MKKIETSLIFEAIGKPQEYLKETLGNIIQKVSGEKGVKVNKSDIKEAIPLKEKESYFSTFAEVEIECEDILTLSSIIIKYLPSHIEIISPEKLEISNNEISISLTEFVRKFHQYDEIARILEFENKLMKAKLKPIILKEKAEKEKSGKKN
jgi:hypothetical protein